MDESQLGELSPTGMRQHYVLGDTLRKEYIETKKFLSEKYDYLELFVFSSDYNRTL